MLKVNGEVFYRSLLALDRMRAHLVGIGPRKPFYGPKDSIAFPTKIRTDMLELRGVFNTLGASLTLRSMDRLIAVLNDQNCTAKQVAAEMAEIESRLRDELNLVSLFAIQEDRAKYFEQPKLFGEEVFESLSSANNDIAEAGTCLALGRGTACVMHLMRVVEAGLKVLASNMGIGPQADWGAYLREIDQALATRIKASGKRTPDEQFYAEARVTIDGVRIAWRNSTMHLENNYSPERAEQILIAVRSLMQHLATKLIDF